MPTWTKRRPPCPSCGSVKQSTLSGGWANDGDLPYTYVRCEDCHYRGLQVSVWLPPEASTTGLDALRRAAMRHRARVARGKLPQLRALTDRRGRRLTDDRVVVTTHIIPGKVESGLAKRLARLRRKREIA